MQYRVVFLMAALALAASTPAAAQVTRIEMKGPATSTTTTTTTTTTTSAKAPFGCNARAPSVCHFRVHYARGSRNVVLPAGMKARVPEVRIGTDTYCVAVNRKPAPSCARKTITAQANS